MAVSVQVDTAEVAVRPLTFDDVLRMVEAGIIGPEERVELIDGVLVAMSPEGLPHAEGVAGLTRLLTDRYPGKEYDVRIGTTQPLSDVSYLLPDAVVLRRVRGRWPTVDDVVLIAEVSKTSIRYDLGRKAREYALWGTPAYWVIDLSRGEVVVHENPRPDGSWATTQVRKVGERLALPGIDAELTVGEVLPGE